MWKLDQHCRPPSARWMGKALMGACSPSASLSCRARVAAKWLASAQPSAAAYVACLRRVLLLYSRIHAFMCDSRTEICRPRPRSASARHRLEVLARLACACDECPLRLQRGSLKLSAAACRLVTLGAVECKLSGEAAWLGAYPLWCAACLMCAAFCETCGLHA